MQNLILLVILVALSFIFVLLIYLIDRLRNIEKTASRSWTPSTSTSRWDSTAPSPDLDPQFASLSGTQIWEGMTGKSVPGWSPEDFHFLRSRYEFILTRHIEQIFESARANPQSQPPRDPTAMIRTLRGKVLSWIPPGPAQKIFELGVRSTIEDSQELRSSLDQTCDRLFEQVQLTPAERFSVLLLPRRAKESPEAPLSAPNGAPSNLDAAAGKPQTSSAVPVNDSGLPG
jgi:hypothetical protein